MKKIKDKFEWVVAGGAVGAMALLYFLGLFLLVFVIAAIFNFIPATVAYMIINWALGFTFTYWQVYWVTYLIVFVFGLRFNSK